MGIYRRYNWHHRDQDFWYEREWPSEWHRHLRSIPRGDVADVEAYRRFVNSDPYESALDDFFLELAGLGEQYLSLASSADALSYFIAFVQHLKYVRESGEYPRFPSEMLIDGGGDCEDSAILAAFIARKLGYSCVFLEFSNPGVFGIGGWGHVALGIAERQHNEFRGTYWTHNGRKYYYVSCNGKNWDIGQYNDKWGPKAEVVPI